MVGMVVVLIRAANNTSAYVWGCAPTMLQGKLYRKDRGRTAKRKGDRPLFAIVVVAVVVPRYDWTVNFEKNRLLFLIHLEHVHTSHGIWGKFI